MQPPKQLDELVALGARVRTLLGHLNEQRERAHARLGRLALGRRRRAERSRLYEAWKREEVREDVVQQLTARGQL